jgi:hypothetical protein
MFEKIKSGMREALAITLHVLVVAVFGFFAYASAALGHPEFGMFVFIVGTGLYTAEIWWLTRGRR